MFTGFDTIHDSNRTSDKTEITDRSSFPVRIVYILSQDWQNHVLLLDDDCSRISTYTHMHAHN